ncbi:PREDICTED: taste receptor type 1 member 1-like, partial [Buceros rhinoceros silvestris]|uniref:taste receptor type 1 member 1-like n=1 Tax=Buceros rhinoceros silvestris TaxID=175836 RepID=UPI0005283F26
SGARCRRGAQPPRPWLLSQISYEASSAMLSLKRFYPSFLRTIPSDGQQVKAIALLLQQFRWTWVALLGSNDAYSRDSLDALYKLLIASDTCVAYRGVIPVDVDASSPELHNLVRILTDVGVNVTVVFSTQQSARPLFEVVVQRNVTGMVWVASEDWSLAQTIWQVPGIQSIGSVIGLSVEQTEPPYDAQASFSVYSAVYAVAHGLHELLGCASGSCSKRTVYPWQLLPKIKQVNFTLYKSRVSFDANGDIRKGYDIIMWNWSGPSWAFDVIGTFRVSPERLILEPGKALWHTSNGQAPASVCSEACQPGEKRLQRSRHRCCFSCVACPSGTFLNRSGQGDPELAKRGGSGSWLLTCVYAKPGRQFPGSAAHSWALTAGG